MEPQEDEDPARSPNAIPLGRRAWVHPSSLVWSFSTSPGPGGQHVNKTATKALLRVDPNLICDLHPAARARLDALMQHRSSDGLASFSSHQHRSQAANRDECIEHLRAIVKQAEIPPHVRRKTKPSRGSKERRLESKQREGQKKKNRGWKGGE
ncbi:MAG: aminoacyl-tRNA hydrolase [Planctomycetes bacterium]|nr:aminoacyl-tRNA hydrolase [Planctomycetota bacterium]